jgi:hypothetical protein
MRLDALGMPRGALQTEGEIITVTVNLSMLETEERLRVICSP